MRWDQGAVTGADGRYETRATVAGNGRHDFWIVVTKEGLPSVAYRAWKGKGFPENRIDLDIVLTSE